MGRIRSKWIKNMSGRLILQYPDRFNTKFLENQKALTAMGIIKDKPIRNKIAGYITTIKHKGKR